MPFPTAIVNHLPRTIRVTKAGTYFILLTLSVGFAAINTGNNLLYLLVAMMLSIIIVSGLLSEQSLRKVTLSADPPPPSFAGEPTSILVRLENRKKRLPSFSLSVSGFIRRERRADTPSKRPSSSQGAYFMKINPRERVSRSLRLTFPRRGCYRLEGFKILTTFPFGLFLKAAARNEPMEIWVYPRHVPIPWERLPTLIQEGKNVADQAGQGAAFHHFRNYTCGDDSRLIHWKLSARQGRLIIREREREAAGEWTILLNNIAPLKANAAWEALFERGIEMVASLCMAILEAGMKVSLRTADQVIQLGEGPAHRELLLKTLTLLEPVSASQCPSPVMIDPAAGSVIGVRLGDDPLFSGRESLFQAVVEIDPKGEASHVVR